MSTTLDTVCTCGAYFNYSLNAIVHKPGCLVHELDKQEAERRAATQSSISPLDTSVEPLKVYTPDPEMREKLMRETPFRLKPVVMGFAPATPGSDKTVAGTVVSSMGAKRFEKATHPYETPATDALDAAYAFVQEHPELVEHIVVCIGKDFGKGRVGSKFFQAGSYNSHAQVGLLDFIKTAMKDSFADD